MHCTFAFYLDLCASQFLLFEVPTGEPESCDAYSPVFISYIGRQTIMWPCYTSDMRRPYNPSRRVTFCRAGKPRPNDQGNADQQWGYVVVLPIQASGKVGNMDDVTVVKAGGLGAEVSVCWTKRGVGGDGEQRTVGQSTWAPLRQGLLQAQQASVST